MTKELMKALKLITLQLDLEQSIHEPTLISGAERCIQAKVSSKRIGYSSLFKLKLSS